jgi:hypothetical protein
MKIPYIKIYTADLLAVCRKLTDEQLGSAVLGICEQAFENDTTYLPDTPQEERLFALLTQWKDEALESYEQNKKKMKKARSARWKKQENVVGKSLRNMFEGGIAQQTDTETKTETETETKTETETENISLTAQAPAAQGERAKTPLPAEFVDRVIERFEQAVATPAQREIFVRRNARCLKDILGFCDHNISLALQTISVCARRLEQGGVSGGYEAVCRNLPEYYEKAKQELQEDEHERD